MIEKTFQDLVESFAAKTPTPGGGAAAALTACLGTALLLMVVRFSRGKEANAEREDDLQKAETLLEDHLQRLYPMAQRDCQSFDIVSAAYKLPKDTEGQKEIRKKAIQEALVGAMVVPEETLLMVRDVFDAVHSVVPCIGKAIVSDLGSGAEHLRAAAECAFMNVRINAGFLGDRLRAETTMEHVRDVRRAVLDCYESIVESVNLAMS